MLENGEALRIAATALLPRVGSISPRNSTLVAAPDESSMKLSTTFEFFGVDSGMCQRFSMRSLTEPRYRWTNALSMQATVPIAVRQDAVERGFARAKKTPRNITGIKVVSEKARIEDGQIAEYLVTLQVIFILEETTTSK